MKFGYILAMWFFSPGIAVLISIFIVWSLYNLTFGMIVQFAMFMFVIGIITIMSSTGEGDKNGKRSKT